MAVDSQHKTKSKQNITFLNTLPFLGFRFLTQADVGRNKDPRDDERRAEPYSHTQFKMRMRGGRKEKKRERRKERRDEPMPA